jgi:hypothetical protein
MSNLNMDSLVSVISFMKENESYVMELLEHDLPLKDKLMQLLTLDDKEGLTHLFSFYDELFLKFNGFS